MLALWIAVMLNGEIHEAIPAIYYSEEDCIQASVEYKGIAEQTSCFYVEEHLIKGKGL